MPNKNQAQVTNSGPVTRSVTGTPPQPEPRTKQALLLELIGREGGANLEELTAATAWLPHTVRAAITGLRKRGHDIGRTGHEGVSRYFLRSRGQ